MSAAEADAVAALIWCPFPEPRAAETAATVLLDEKLIACANILPAMVSLFEWDGKRDRAQEAAVIFKTNARTLERAVGRLAEIHPYDEPAIVGWRCDSAAPGTLAWLGALGR